VTFTIPTGIVNVTPPAGCSLAGTVYTCSIASALAVGATRTFIFNGQIAAAGGSTVTGAGAVQNASPTDPIASNNTATGNIAVSGGTDIAITKGRSPSGTLLVGDSVTFTLNGSYTGDSPSGITVSDTIPINYSITSITAPGWDCLASAGQDVTCTRTSGSGAGANVSLGAIAVATTAVSSGTPLNTATIGATGPTDSNLANNTATDGGATINVPVVDLRANKSGPAPALAVVGNNYNYTISTSIVGNSAFFGTINMVDSIPAGLTVNAITANGWSCSPALPLAGATSLTCSRVYTAGAPLNAGATTPGVVLQTTVTAAGVLSNGLQVGSPDANIADLNPANDIITYDVTAEVAGNSADVSATKTATLATVPAGNIQTFDLEIINTGASTAQNVRVIDNFTSLINNGVGPTGAGYVSHSISAGAASGISCSTSATGGRSRQLVCDVPVLPVCIPGNDCPVITVQVRPGGNAGGRTNTFSAISQATPDPILGNNSASAGYSVDARADVTVSKSDTPDPVAAGQNLTYIVTARNLANGLSAADNVTITDTLPANLTFISVSPSAGSCSTAPAANSVTGPGNDQLVCNLGTIANGAQRTVSIFVRPNNATRATTLNNTVTVSTTTVETDATNNSASETTAVSAPDVDILVNKNDSIDPVAVGNNTVYTVTITNTGPSASENIVMTDTLPTANLTYQSHTVSGAGSCATVPGVGTLGGTLVCSWPYLEAGNSETVQVTMQGVSKGTVPNNVSISSDEILAGFDRLAANNQTLETTTVRTKADVELVSKTATPATVNLNDDFAFTAIVRVNPGPGLAEADNVTFSDTLPAGMVLTGAPTATITSGSATSNSCTGAAGGTSFTCDLGTVTATSVVSINLPVEVTSVNALPDTLTNSASVSTSSFEVNPANNSTSGPVTVGSSSIAGTVFRDFANDAAITAGDTGVLGVAITLTGTSFDGKTVTLAVNTDASGNFLFPFIPQGTYTVTRGAVSEAYLTNGSNSAGSQGGTITAPTVISSVSVPANTAALNYLFALIPQARVGIAKAVNGPVTTNADGSFNVTFRMVVENFSLEALINMVVRDPLAGALPLFGSYQVLGAPSSDPMPMGSYTFLAAPSGSCGGVNSGFDGAGDTTLASGFGLAAGGTCTIDISLRVRPATPTDSYLNQATVTGDGQLSGQTPATNPDLTDISDNGANPDPNGNGTASDANEDDPTPVAASVGPAIALIKTVDTSGLSIPAQLGEVIAYNFAITNTGNVTLTNVTLSDVLSGIVISGGPIASLAPGGSDTTTFTATYILTQPDIDAGQVTNQATASGTDPYGTVSDLSGVTTGDDIALVTPLVATPGIALVKAVDASALGAPPQAGDTLSYSFAITNTGNVTLTNITLSDPLPGISISGGPIVTMAPGAVDSTTYTATYTLTQADIDAGKVQNQATASGTPPSGPNVSDLSGTTTGDDIPTVAALANAPAIALIKTADTSALSMPGQVGEIITYNFAITNTGNVTLTNITLSDVLPGIAISGGPVASLAPGGTDSTTYVATYALTAADAAVRRVMNQATTTGTPPSGPTVSDLSGTSNADDNPTFTQVGPATAIAGVSMTKTTPSDIVRRGAAVPYTITVSNINAFPLALLNIVDTLPPSFVYVPGTATIGGVATTVSVAGRIVTWPNVTVPASGSTTVALSARILNGIRAGEHVNRVNLVDSINGVQITAPATATVRILPEGVFDCGEVIGKVFNDRNGNGYQDPSVGGSPAGAITDQTYYGSKGRAEKAPEPKTEDGLPGVRLATVDGLVITTDEYGRFSVPCAMLPADRGSNFILKLDTRSLPAGFRVTTENPRVVRLTPGMMSEVNFGAAIGPVARVDLADAAFLDDGTPSAGLSAGLARLAGEMAKRPGTVRLAYHVARDASVADVRVARQRMKRVAKVLKRVWRDTGRGQLLIEQTIRRAGN